VAARHEAGGGGSRLGWGVGRWQGQVKRRGGGPGWWCSVGLSGKGGRLADRGPMARWAVSGAMLGAGCPYSTSLPLSLGLLPCCWAWPAGPWRRGGGPPVWTAVAMGPGRERASGSGATAGHKWWAIPRRAGEGGGQLATGARW